MKKLIDNVNSNNKPVKDPIWKNKKIMAVIGVVLLIIACAGGYLYSQEQKKQQILDSIQIAFIEDPVIEYGDTDFDYGTLIKQKTDEVILPDPIDSMQTGEFEVVYKVEKEGYTKEFPLKIEVKDTKAPVITFKNDTVSLEVGSEFKAADNIKSVVDPIDGDIAFVADAGESNYYVIEGSVDTATAGEYTITIKAVDKNGNEAEKAFKVEVKEKVVDPVNNTGGGNSYYQQPSYSAGGDAGSSGSSGGGSSNNSTVCEVGVPNEPVVNGIWSTADAALQSMLDNDETGTVVAVFDKCGNVIGYTKFIQGINF